MISDFQQSFMENSQVLDDFYILIYILNVQI